MRTISLLLLALYGQLPDILSESIKTGEETRAVCYHSSNKGEVYKYTEISTFFLMDEFKKGCL